VSGRVVARKSDSARDANRVDLTTSPPGVPSAVDTTWYAAQDIDSYPRAVAPLRIARPAGTSETVTRLRLWLRIDERGEVVEVSAGEPGIPAAWVSAARASLAGIRFEPARKDERAVRSRLLLSISFADAGTGDQRLETRD